MEIKNLVVIQVTGTRDYAEMQSKYMQSDIDCARWILLDYCDRMGETYAAADLVLSRAGATTLAELTALSKPALLVPYPFAAANEQAKNAASLVEIGAAHTITDSQLDEPIFMEKLLALLSDESLREQMVHCASAHAHSRARQTFAKMIIEVACERNKK